jgi:CRISPR system Cascade subunit CasE
VYISQVIVQSTEPYEQHKAIWSLFNHAEQRKRDHLFRVESVNGRQCNMILQSATKPTSTNEVKVLNTKEYAPSINQGTYRFKITANPTKKCGETRRIIDFKIADEQIAWLQRKLTGNNVTVTSLDSTIVNIKRNERARFVTFEGVIHVLEPDIIFSQMMLGIGRKKHAGAGLLTLAKIG